MKMQREKGFDSCFIAERFMSLEKKPQVETDPDKVVTAISSWIETTLGKMETEEKHDAGMKTLASALKQAGDKRAKRRRDEFEAAKSVLQAEHHKKVKDLEQQLLALKKGHDVEIESVAKKFKIAPA